MKKSIEDNEFSYKNKGWKKQTFSDKPRLIIEVT